METISVKEFHRSEKEKNLLNRLLRCPLVGLSLKELAECCCSKEAVDLCKFSRKFEGGGETYCIAEASGVRGGLYCPVIKVFV